MAQTFIVDCPICSAKVAAEEMGSAERAGFDEEPGEPFGERLVLGKCPSCGILLAGYSWQTHFKNFDSEFDDWSDVVRIYPKPPKLFSSLRIPTAVTTSLMEGDKSLQADAPIAACVMFGRALEAMCRDVLFTPEEKKGVSEGTGKKRMMLGEGIRQLRARNIIEDRLFEWSQQLRAFRNLAAHPEGDAGAIPRQNAEDLQTFVHAIIEYIYDLTDRYAEFKERQEKKQKPKGSQALEH